MHKPKDSHVRPTYLFVIVLVVVLAGVALGSMLGLRKAEKDFSTRFDPPKRMGHIALPPPSAGPNTNEMTWIPGGTFSMGDNEGQQDERPAHPVNVTGFWMDKYEVTNEQFDRFIRATHYVTVAERKPDPKDFPNADPSLLVPGSVVFSPPPGEVPLDDHSVWWKYVPGANWRHPEGPNSNLKGREKNPAIHICWEDAVAYAGWCGKRLPTEAEWEFAARGGLEKKKFTWGDEITPDGKWQANIWQGQFPNENKMSDGFRGTAPVGSFPPNGFGLYDMAGNVWEWCADWYRFDYYAPKPRQQSKRSQ